MLLVNVPLAVVTVNRIVLPYGIFTHAPDTPRSHPHRRHPTPSNSHKPRAPQSISMLFKQGSGNPSVVANKQKWQRQRPVSDGQTAALGYLSLLRPVCVCVCVFLGTSRNWATPIVSRELRSAGVAGNGQRPWRCAASGGSALWRWPGRLFPWPVQLSCGWGPLLSLSDSGCVCFHRTFPHLLPLFQHWLRYRGSEVAKGLDDERDGLSGKRWPFCVHLGRVLLPIFFKKILLPWRFPSSNAQAPAHSPVGTHPPVWWPQAVAVTLALAVKVGGQTCHSITVSTLSFP